MSTWNDTRVTEPPKDRPVLMIARLNVDGDKLRPMVGEWLESEHEWRPTVNDVGTELIVSYWMEIPEMPVPSAQSEPSGAEARPG
jgi:hypothetical protein